MGADTPDGAVAVGADIISAVAGAEAAITKETGSVPAGVVMTGAGTGDRVSAPTVIMVAKLAAREAGSGWGIPAMTAGSRTESGGEAEIIW